VQLRGEMDLIKCEYIIFPENVNKNLKLIGCHRRKKIRMTDIKEENNRGNALRAKKFELSLIK